MEIVGSALRERAPSFFSGDDQVIVRASDLVRSARLVAGTQERDELLLESLKVYSIVVPVTLMTSQLYKRVIKHISLTSVCNEYMELAYFTGVVDLALLRAAEDDPEGLGAIATRVAVADIEDSRVRAAVLARFESYQCILNAFAFLYGLPCMS